MTDNTETPQRRFRIGGWKFIVAVILILAYSASAAYGIMSDTSIRGLTVKMFNISRSCTTDLSTSLKTLNFNIRGSIWSTSSLQTSLSHISFTLSVDGLGLGTTTQSDGSFGPGQGITFSLPFTHPTLNPAANQPVLPPSSKLVLAVSATVVAGLYGAVEAASDSTVQNFSSSSC
ncbi:MAG TPA: hypothetical protein VGS11_08775 [Candidatus Bathyarchaeia archaeon]|nr:hypothetical protein [Candidatus Bathyarchaeia archaeon]